MKITMAHGSGGRDSAALMEEIFGKHFKNPVLDRLEDAAVLPMEDWETGSKMACSTDTFVVTPLRFPGGNIGKLAVCGTVNDLLMMGAEPMYLTCGFVLQEGLETDVLEEVVKSMAQEAAAAGVVIVAGDTKVVEGHGEMYINTAGVGRIPPGRIVNPTMCREGDAILLSGTMGDHHACILSARMGIENKIESDCACLWDITNALFEAGINVRTMRDVTRGGLATILNEIAKSAGLSALVEEKSIPVAPAVAGLCGMLGLEPFYMANEGKLLLVVPGEEKQRALEILRATTHGKDAAIIGEMKGGKGVLVRTPLGSTRVLDLLYGEGLPRIC